MRSATSSPVRSGNVPVEDGDVVGVDAQQLESGVAVNGDVCRDRFQAQAIADGFCHVGLVLDEQHTHAPDATSWRISSAYRKPHTFRQHHAAQTGGVPYSEPARTTTRRIRSADPCRRPASRHRGDRRSPRPPVAGVLVGRIPIDVLRSEHRGAPMKRCPTRCGRNRAKPLSR